MNKSAMRKVSIHKPGGYEELRIEECEIPTPKAGEVLIEVHCAGVSLLLIRWFH
jgi:NADPH:quinone reductase-like Zn-dependent oxidoreductase